MKVLIILAVLGCCYSLPFIRDTPEVTAEKQRFFQLFDAATARAAAARADNSIVPRQASRSAHQFTAPQTNFAWQGPVAATVPAGVNGNFAPVSNTAEVDAAIRSFQLAYDQAVRDTAPRQHHRFAAQTVRHPVAAPRQQHRFAAHTVRHPVAAPVTNAVWKGPVAATIPAGLPGSVNQVRNTPEVDAAIAEFTRSYNDAVRATTGAHVQPTFSQSNRFRTFTQSAPVPLVNQQWNGPFASSIPAGLPGSSGQVADTAEVSAAKAAFNRAFQQQLGFRG